MRRIQMVSVVGLAAVAAGAAGCGGSGAAPSAQGPVTQERIDAYGRAVNLRGSDISLSVKEPPSDRQGVDPEEITACAAIGGEDSETTAAGAPTFTRQTEGGVESFSSQVLSAPSFAMTRQNNALLRSAQGSLCLQRYLEAELGDSIRKSDGHVLAMEVTPIPPLTAAPGGFGMRLTMLAEIGDRPLPAFVDLFGFLSPATEIELFAVGVGRPPDSLEEERLLQTLYDRARAADF